MFHRTRRSMAHLQRERAVTHRFQQPRSYYLCSQPAANLASVLAASVPARSGQLGLISSKIGTCGPCRGSMSRQLRCRTLPARRPRKPASAWVARAGRPDQPAPPAAASLSLACSGQAASPARAQNAEQPQPDPRAPRAASLSLACSGQAASPARAQNAEQPQPDPRAPRAAPDAESARAKRPTRARVFPARATRRPTNAHNTQSGRGEPGCSHFSSILSMTWDVLSQFARPNSVKSASGR
jgi:hypothetical protein